MLLASISALDPSGLATSTQASAEPRHRVLYDAVMSPLQRVMRHAIGQAHWTLHHLNGPGDLDVCADSLGAKRNTRFPFEVAVHERFDDAWFVAPCQLDLDTHPIWQRRGHHAVQHCAREQRTALESKFFQPGPPNGELIDLL